MSDSNPESRDGEPSSDRSTARWVSLALVATLAAIAGAFDLFDYDLGLARVTGEFILEHGVPRTNVFSAVHADFPFVDDKWLFHVFAHLVVDGVGETFAIVLRMMFLVATFVLLLPRRGASSLEQFLGALLAVIAIATSHERFAFRPELFTFLFLAVLWRRLRDPAPFSRREWIGFLFLQWVWTNTHGYWVLGPILAGAVVAGRWLDARVLDAPHPSSSLRAGMLLPIALIAVGVANPYGFELLASPVRILLDLRGFESTFKETIVEFVPPFGYHPRLPTDLVAYRVLLLIVAIAVAASIRRPRFADLLPLLAFFLMSLDLRRNVAPFAIVAAPLASSWLAAAVPPRWARAVAGVSAWCAALLALALGFAFASGWISRYDRLDRIPGFATSTLAYPAEEIAFVKEHLPADGMFNSFIFGSTFVGLAFPERRAFIDGNTAGYPPSFLRRYVDTVLGDVEPDELVDEYGLRYFLIRPGHVLTTRLLASPRYVPVFLGRHAVVVVVADRVDPSFVEAFDIRRALADGSYSPIVTSSPDAFPTAEINRARLELALGLQKRAITTLESALNRSDGDPGMRRDAWEVLHALGAARMFERDWTRALAELDAAAAIAPGSAEIAADRAIVLAALGRHQDAEDALRFAIARRGEDADLMQRLAQVAAARRDLVGARAALARAIELTTSAPGKARIQELLDRLPR